jgi:hypothetical protein
MKGLDTMVYAMGMIRKWLRRMIGWNEMQARLDLSDVRLTVVVTRANEQDSAIEAQRKRIDVIAYRRDIAHVPDPVLDWEAQQQAFLSNPDNFKEVN